MYLFNYSEINVLKTFTGTPFVAPTTVYLTLSSTDPGDDGSAVLEPSYSGYVRKAFVATAPAPVSGIANSIGFQNNSEIKFARAPADQATATHIAIYDSPSGGNGLIYAKLETPKQIRTNVEPTLRVGEAKFWFASSNTTAELKTRILNVFRGITMAAVTPYISLANGAEEVHGGNFERVLAAFTAPTELATGQYEISNASLLEFAIASVALGNYDTDCLFDASTGGSKLISFAGSADYYSAGDRTAYDPGEWKLALN